MKTPILFSFISFLELNISNREFFIFENISHFEFFFSSGLTSSIEKWSQQCRAEAVTLFYVFFIRISFRKQEIRHVRTMWVRVIFRCLQTCFQQVCVLQKFKFKYLVILNGTLSGKYFFVKKTLCQE